MIVTFAGAPNRYEARARPPSRKVKIICIAVNIASAAVIGWVLFKWIAS